jgi:hypothetical protein
MYSSDLNPMLSHASKNVPLRSWGLMLLKIINGRKMAVQNIVLRNKTERTALSFKDCFLATS